MNRENILSTLSVFFGIVHMYIIVNWFPLLYTCRSPRWYTLLLIFAFPVITYSIYAIVFGVIGANKTTSTILTVTAILAWLILSAPIYKYETHMRIFSAIFFGIIYFFQYAFGFSIAWDAISRGYVRVINKQPPDNDIIRCVKLAINLHETNFKKFPGIPSDAQYGLFFLRSSSDNFKAEYRFWCDDFYYKYQSELLKLLEVRLTPYNYNFVMEHFSGIIKIDHGISILIDTPKISLKYPIPNNWDFNDIYENEFKRAFRSMNIDCGGYSRRIREDGYLLLCDVSKKIKNTKTEYSDYF